MVQGFINRRMSLAMVALKDITSDEKEIERIQSYFVDDDEEENIAGDK